MKISIVTDEISSDPETALELASAWGIHDVELRGVGSERVPFLSPFSKEQLGEALDRYQCQVVAVSPGLFKIPFPPGSRISFPVKAIDADLFQAWRQARELLRFQVEELLPASLAFCRELGARVLVAFGFSRGGLPPGPVPDDILLTCHDAADQCGKMGITLAIEVEEGFWADTGERSARLVQKIDHPALGLNWDPGNAFDAGEVPYPDGYSHVGPFVRHVHYKDAIRAHGRIEYAVRGEIDWPGQIKALAQDDYQGFISVETHMRPKVTSAKAAYERLRALVVERSESATGLERGMPRSGVTKFEEEENGQD